MNDVIVPFGVERVPAGIAGLPVPSRASAPRAFGGLVRRDLLVMVRQWPSLVIGVVVQPFLLVFVFTYVLPKAGFAVGGASKAAMYSTLLVAGVVGLSTFTQGFTGVTIRFSIEFGYTKEIEDRIMAPLPVWSVGLEKVLVGALQAAMAGIMVFPISALVPATPVHLSIHPAVLVPAAVLAALTAAAFGLALGTLIDPSKMQLAATALVLPVTFFGAVYYPWESLSHIAWLKTLELVNPLVYMNEMLRAGLTSGIPHMPVPVGLSAMCVFVVGLTMIGIRGLQRRIVT